MASVVTQHSGPKRSLKRGLLVVALMVALVVTLFLVVSQLPAIGVAHVRGLTDQEFSNMQVNLQKPPRLVMAELVSDEGLPAAVLSVVFPDGTPVYGRGEAVAFATSGDAQPQDVLDAQLLLASSTGPLKAKCDSSPLCPIIGQAQLYWLVVTRRHLPQGTLGDRAVTFVDPYGKGAFRVLLGRS
jgi:hypothetical protein